MSNLKTIDKKFWNDYCQKYGHTGWNNPSIYFYDQFARLKAIEKIISSINCKRESALDFGTGSGDFAKLLAQDFKNVIAYDISENVLNVAHKKYKGIQNIEFIHKDNIEEIKIDDASLDIILSVTVLDHIMDDNKLSKTIQFFKKKLSDNGYIVALEYALPNKQDNTTYQRFWTFEKWCSLFHHHGFKLKKYFGFYHPTDNPCKSFLNYRNNLKVRILNRFRNFKLSQKYLKNTAESYLNNENDFIWEGRKEDTLRIMIFKIQDIEKIN